MHLFKKVAMIVFILLLVVTGACSKNQTQSDETTPSKIAKTDVIVEEETPPAARTVEEMIDQKAGVLIEEHMDQRLETLESWDRQQYLDFIEQTFNPIAEKEFKSYFTKHKNLTSEQIYDYLVYTLGSGNYKSYYEKLADYEHGYVMPELPNGDNKVTTEQKKMNTLVLMDASGSMNEILEGRTKMEQAKEAISEFVTSIPEDTNVSLIAYGHVGSSANSDKANSCSSVETVYPLSTYQPKDFTTSINSFQASG